LGAFRRSARSVSSAPILGLEEGEAVGRRVAPRGLELLLIVAKKKEAPPVTRSLTISSNDWRLTGLLNCRWKSGEEQMPSYSLPPISNGEIDLAAGDL